jgi:catechol 2,3-dioxygenase-like lactoylglutathione lyase family enzyme
MDMLLPSEDEFYPMPAFPTLTVSSLSDSRQFYVEGLGFKHVFSVPGPSGQPVVEHVRFCRYADLLLEQQPEDDGDPSGMRGLGVQLTFSLPLAGQNALALALRARELGTQVEGPIERPWNTRDVVVTDPDGYVLVFTEPVDVNLSFDDVLESISGRR